MGSQNVLLLFQTLLEKRTLLKYSDLYGCLAPELVYWCTHTLAHKNVSRFKCFFFVVALYRVCIHKKCYKINQEEFANIVIAYAKTHAFKGTHLLILDKIITFFVKTSSINNESLLIH